MTSVVNIQGPAPASATGQPETPVRLPTQRSHALDAKIVTDVFAQIGIVCAVLLPEKEELAGLGDLVMLVGANADVLILDWVLCDSKLGERALDLIKRMVASAAESGRARLILVYTAIGLHRRSRPHYD
jgi:hypothetical protein